MNELTDEQINEQAAKMMGWTRVEGQPDVIEINGEWFTTKDDPYPSDPERWNPAGDYNHAMMLRDKVAELDKFPFGRGTKYRRHLVFVDGIMDAQDDEPITEMLMATARQITQACIKALEDKKDMKINLEEIEAKAKAATPGDWTFECMRGKYGESDGGFVKAPRRNPTDPYDIEIMGDDTNDELYPTEQKEADGQHIASADPPTVLALVSRVRELLKVVAENAIPLEALNADNFIGAKWMVPELREEVARACVRSRAALEGSL